ncbi:MAG: TetR/AcrR family transcriptional regulator [Asticcacaulis sp.]
MTNEDDMPDCLPRFIRRNARRRQILEAAQRCVMKAGFHGASMSEIASEARISVGIIYRHFRCKEDIIAVLVTEETERSERKFLALGHLTVEKLMSAIRIDIQKENLQVYMRQRAAFHLEVLSEASRNEKVLKILRDAETRERALAIKVCHQLSPDCDPTRIEAKAEIMTMIFDGIWIRSVVNPRLDLMKVMDGVEQLLTRLFASDTRKSEIC